MYIFFILPQILSAILACAAAAPSTIFGAAPVAIPGIPALAAIPTISPGDLQAAAIDAKVQAEDLIRATADKNLEIAGQIIEGQSEKTLEAKNLVNEKSQEAFWEVEDKKWQALTALQTAQAKLEGIVASNANLLGQTVLVPAPIVPVPGGPIAYGALVKSGEKIEEKKEEAVKTEQAAVQSAEATVKATEAKPEEKDSVQIEAAKQEKVEAAPKSPLAEGSQSAAAETAVKPQVVGPVVAPLAFPKLVATPLAGLPLNYNGVSVFKSQG